MTESLLVFGAHPDDIEFGCGGIVSMEVERLRSAHFVVCSRGEAGTNGNAQERESESRKAAQILGATIEFLEFAGDSHLNILAESAIRIAEVIRRIRPSTVLAPTLTANQHPDHTKLASLVRDACRLARYGGLKELLHLEKHSIEQLFYYAITPDAEPSNTLPIIFDISSESIVSRWTEAMLAHKSQATTRNYVDLQLTRSKLMGARAGVTYATALYPNDAHIFQSLAQAGKGARNF